MTVLTTPEDVGLAAGRPALQKVFAGNWSLLVGTSIVAVMLLAALASFALPSSTIYGQSLAERLMAPSSTHWFGTDELGRDMFFRTLAGARVTLLMVVLVALFAGPVGLLLGATAGYAGGWLDGLLMRVTDIALALPRLVLALALAAALGAGVLNAALAIALTAWPPYARVARAEAMSLRKADFVVAARLQGASEFRIVTRYILPLCVSSVLVRMSLDMTGVILTAAGLGFLGLGAQPPIAEWGAMVSAGRASLLESPWVAAIPGAAIFLTSLGFNLVGEGMRDALDPRNS